MGGWRKPRPRPCHITGALNPNGRGGKRILGRLGVAFPRLSQTVNGDPIGRVCKDYRPWNGSSGVRPGAPVLHELVKKQPGLIMHVAYPTPGGFSVGEVWESQAQQESWFNQHVTPNLPPEIVDAASTEYFPIHALVQP